ncbi:ubiquitin carboxyl-terminal hydrolase 43 [Meleagris gallopavo]|uniref:ubiquitin carboxyl-terminal hydrolase 43 n=1 Tax=Meleagris gallopavo TaxID=9103 RepID=UPI0012ABFCF4|nr:ubiquitin carboxyl-terminal hydrolase 43 [Meleagris gallopavo]
MRASEVSSTGGSCTFPGQLCQRIATLSEKNFPPTPTPRAALAFPLCFPPTHAHSGGDHADATPTPGRSIPAPLLCCAPQSIVAKHGAQFRGNAQHDALEFLLWLLDRMHEDLGSASPAPGPRAAHQRSAEQSGASGESFVQSHFQAQYRSSLTCPHCRKQSNTFDPFLCISLPIPVRQTRALNVTLVLQREGGRSLRVGLAVPLLGTAAELREMVAREGDVPPQQVILAEVSSQGFLRSLDDTEELSTAGQEAPLYALQAPPEAPTGARPVLLLLLCHVAGIGPHRARFGPPLVLWAERGASWAQLQRDVLAPLRGMMRSAVQGTAPQFRIHVAGEPSAYLSPQDPHPLCHVAIDRALQQSPAGGPPHVALTVNWDISTKERLFGSVQQEAVQDADSVRLQQAAHQQHSCTLDECFQLYTKEEQLAPDDAWRCPHCRVLQQGTVQLRLWTLPDILIIHLKRFRQVAQRRHKLSTLVRFPLRGLDMAPHLAPGGDDGSTPAPTRSCPPDALYDLYAVCNHHGSMQGGHYTAYCCNSLDGRWYSYDDSTVEGVREDEVSTRSAYILFYQRRNAIPAWSASSATRGSSSSAPLNHWAAQLGGSKQHSAESQPAAPRPSPPCSPDLSTTQEQGGFEARPHFY